METWRMTRRCLCVQEQQLVFKRIAALLVLFCCAVTGNKNQGTYKKIFIIGDSYVDNGNRNPYNNTYTAIGRVNQPWETPFGRTNPALAGRFSDGKVLSDYIANYIGLKPRPYRVLSVHSSKTRVQDGINFAVGGAGVFNNLGFTKSGDQINQLSMVLNRRHPLYFNNVYGESLILFVISGNDYGAFVRSATYAANPHSIIPFVTDVVKQIVKDLEKLYRLGFRSFAVAKLAPLGCLPSATALSNFTACDETTNSVVTLHNQQLLQLTASLPKDAKIIFLDTQLAFNTVVYNPAKPDRLKPCCTGLQFGRLCGDVDPVTGAHQYTLCSRSSTSNYFFWDEVHPTEAGWQTIFNAFLQGPPYVFNDAGQTLTQFLGL